MEKLKWAILYLMLFPVSVSASQLELTTIHLVSQSGHFAFTSNNPYRNFAGNAYYRAANPFCRELSAGYHMTEFPRLKRRLALADLEFSGPKLLVPQTQPSRAFCHYELMDLYAMISINNTINASIRIYSNDDGPSEVDIYCHKPILDETDSFCRTNDGMYDSAVALQLNLEGDVIKVHAHLEDWNPDKDPERSEEDIPWQKKYRGK